MIQFRLETFNTFNHVAVQRHQYRRERAQRRPAGHGGDARHAWAGDELPRSAPDPGGVEDVFLGLLSAWEACLSVTAVPAGVWSCVPP